MSKVKNKNGAEIDYVASIMFMDDELRECLHNNGEKYLTDQEFFTAYEKSHEAWFGEEWELSKPNPVW